jgi:anti-sigma factor RsiW
VLHLADDVLEALTLGALTTVKSLQVQKHIFDCPECLKRLIGVELALALRDVNVPPRSLKPDMRKPLSVRHDTADGFIYSRVEKRADKWMERHWGGQLDGGSEFATMSEANEHALAAFAQMFPEHRCTDRCCVDRPTPE